MSKCAARTALAAASICALLRVSLAAQVPNLPSAPQVVVHPDSSVTLSYGMSGGSSVHGAFLFATRNGAVVPGIPIFIGTRTAVSSGPLPPGTYNVQVLVFNGFGITASNPSTFVIPDTRTAPGAPVLAAPAVSGNRLTLSWTRGAGVATAFELQVRITSTGQIVTMPVGNVSSLSFSGVPPGQYEVRVRALNQFGSSAFSNVVLVSVGQATSEALLYANPLDPRLFGIRLPTSAAVDVYGSKTGDGTVTSVSEMRITLPDGAVNTARVAQDGRLRDLVTSDLLVSFSWASPTSGTITVRSSSGALIGSAPFGSPQLATTTEEVRFSSLDPSPVLAQRALTAVVSDCRGQHVDNARIDLEISSAAGVQTVNMPWLGSGYGTTLPDSPDPLLRASAENSCRSLLNAGFFDSIVDACSLGGNDLAHSVEAALYVIGTAAAGAGVVGGAVVLAKAPAIATTAVLFCGAATAPSAGCNVYGRIVDIGERLRFTGTTIRPVLTLAGHSGPFSQGVAKSFSDPALHWVFDAPCDEPRATAPNAVTLSGRWRVSYVAGDADDYWMSSQGTTADRSVWLNESLDVVIDDDANSGWELRFFEDAGECDGTPANCPQLGYLEVAKIDSNTYELHVDQDIAIDPVINDLVLRLRRVVP